MKIEEQKKHEYHKKNPWMEDEENRLSGKRKQEVKTHERYGERSEHFSEKDEESVNIEESKTF